MDIEKDKIFELAERYVNCTGRSVFLTGKAGTGKTTFLKYIAQSTMKRFVILAPTGVAAINAGGSTIHSFFHGRKNQCFFTGLLFLLSKL